MSRGLGKAEQAIIADLAKRARQHPDWPDRPIRLDVLADATGLHPESLRRAMKTLTAKGITELGWDNGWRVYDTGEVHKAWGPGPTVCLSAEKLSALTTEQPAHT